MREWMREMDDTYLWMRMTFATRGAVSTRSSLQIERAMNLILHTHTQKYKKVNLVKLLLRKLKRGVLLLYFFSAKCSEVLAIDLGKLGSRKSAQSRSPIHFLFLRGKKCCCFLSTSTYEMRLSFFFFYFLLWNLFLLLFFAFPFPFFGFGLLAFSSFLKF